LSHNRNMPVISRFNKRGVAVILRCIHIRALIEQITNRLQATLAGGQPEWRVTIASGVYIYAGQMKPLHAIKTSVHCGLGKVSLPPLFEFRQVAEDRQRPSQRTGEGYASKGDYF